FQGINGADVLVQVLANKPVPPRQLAPEIPAALEQICLKAMAKDPHERYATAADFAADLRRLLDEPASSEEAKADGPIDQNVQFNAYSPKNVRPQEWYTMQAFAYLAERPAGAPALPDPAQEVQKQARQALGDKMQEYQGTIQDSEQPVSREGELIFVPEVEG